MTAPTDSLTDRLIRRTMRATRTRPKLAFVPDIRLALALAGLVALGPLLTIVGAKGLRAGVEAENKVLEAQLRTRTAPQAARDAAAAELRDAVRRPALVATLERLARALPDDARLVSAERDASGALKAEIATNDPDLLRGALRVDPLLAALREVGQRRTPDARVVVMLRTRA
ncbi:MULTISPECIES: hypothetical protein [unclassified Sphingomonas]|uniref:hypothetical protein n=1 Tax=unclassified Sphingomonas TaxID=196159 RepID=UPI0008362C66|nr:MULTISPECIES: hypothetical protein [unclassified Sphingomonas]